MSLSKDEPVEGWRVGSTETKSNYLTGRGEALRFGPMVLATLPFPDIDRVALHIWGSLAIRWYALAYIAGLLFGWWAAARMTRDKELWKNPPFAGKPPLTADQVGDLVVWATFGVILGGRIGWILFYIRRSVSGYRASRDFLLPSSRSRGG